MVVMTNLIALTYISYYNNGWLIITRLRASCLNHKWFFFCCVELYLFIDDNDIHGYSTLAVPGSSIPSPVSQEHSYLF